MKKIGFIDLDTMHARSFLPRLNAIPDILVTHVFDRARVRGPEETRKFCCDFNVTSCESTEELADCTDGVMILSADWNTHFDDLKLMIEIGTPAFCDKPLVGSLHECNALVELCKKYQTPLLCGSGWRWNKQIQTAHQKFKDDEIHNLFICSPNGFFYYGIHAIECLLGILGPGITWVKTERHEGDEGTLVAIGHRRGGSARVMLRAPFFYRDIHFSVNGTPHNVSITSADIHDGICSEFSKMVRTGKAIGTMAEYTEPVKTMLAIEQSIRTGKQVSVDENLLVREIIDTGFMKKYIAEYEASLKK